MKTKDLVVAAILLALGTILHAIMPPFFAGIKPDFLLAMMFLAIIYKPEIKNTIAIGIVAGIIAALTTGMPGGQIPSLIDKIGSAIIVFFIIKAMVNMNIIKTGIIGFIGTIISGLLFLFSLMFIAAIPGGETIMTLFKSVVLLTAVMNTIIVIIAYKIMDSIVD
ncbi:MAG: tryptophan transporter [Andreesenia angusta]|nr:tryptophan transporter [Andreesenia angusta]